MVAPVALIGTIGCRDVAGELRVSHLLLHPLTDAWLNLLVRHLRWLLAKAGQEVFQSWAKVWRLLQPLVFSAAALVMHGSQALVFVWFCDVAEAGLTAADCMSIFVQATLFSLAGILLGCLGAISIRLVTLWFGMLLGGESLWGVGSKTKCT